MCGILRSIPAHRHFHGFCGITLDLRAALTSVTVSCTSAIAVKFGWPLPAKGNNRVS